MTVNFSKMQWVRRFPWDFRKFSFFRTTSQLTWKNSTYSPWKTMLLTSMIFLWFSEAMCRTYSDVISPPEAIKISLLQVFQWTSCCVLDCLMNGNSIFKSSECVHIRFFDIVSHEMSSSNQKKNAQTGKLSTYLVDIRPENSLNMFESTGNQLNCPEKDRFYRE